MSAGASAGAAGAAAAARRRMQEEEEMTTYSSQELSDNWEFKILRSVRSAFRDTEKLKQVLAEESRAGWILVEKFDNGRIRLKRPAIAREMDGKLDFDPYRTSLGPSETQFALVIVAALLGVFATVLAIIFLVSNANRDHPVPQMPRPIETVAPPAESPPKDLP